MQESPLPKPDTIPTSPVVAQKSERLTMSFPEVLAALIIGEKITRVEWNSDDEYGMLKNEYLMIHTKGKDHTWLVSEPDMKATDWMILR